MKRKIQIKMLPKAVLNYLNRLEYRKSVADEESFANLSEELEKFGFEYVDQDIQIGDYNDLRGYLNCYIREKK